VNFFGHAAVASWRDAKPAVALGAMLPDFATMCRARLDAPGDPGIAEGVELHHATDAAFHQLPVVTDLMRELAERLALAGCARGPRRAVAHVGMELLLDGVLVEEAAYRASYERGLGYEPAGGGVRWGDAEGDERFSRLVARLRAYGAPFDLREPAAIARRLQHMLADRPRLAPDAGDLRAIQTCLVEERPRVEVATDELLRALRASLMR
jgi:hypothetical protein